MKTKQKQNKKQRLVILDCLCVAVGVTASILTIALDHGYALPYIIASLFALNCGIMEMVLGVKGRRTSYIFAIGNAIASIFIAFFDQYYGNMVINIYYVPLSIFGFLSWTRHRDTKKNVIARKLTSKQIIIATVVLFALSFVLNYLLRAIDGNMTVIDSIATILIIYASLLGALRYREQWLVWIAADFMMLIMWINSSNLAIMTLRLFYIVASIYGYYNWRKFIKKKT